MRVSLWVSRRASDSLSSGVERRSESGKRWILQWGTGRETEQEEGAAVWTDGEEEASSGKEQRGTESGGGRQRRGEG